MMPWILRIRYAWAVLLGEAPVVDLDAEQIDFRRKLMALVDEFNAYIAHAASASAAKDAADAANVTALAAANEQIATLTADATATSQAIATADAALTPPA
jgi:hypothetical protein